MGEQIKVKFADGSFQNFPSGITIAEATKTLQGIVTAEVDSKLVDLSFTLKGDIDLTPITIDSKKGLEILRHSTAHIMAQAVKELYPECKISIGPATEDGFYYDFDYEKGFTPEDFEPIEKRIQEIVDKDLPFTRTEIPKEEAMRLFTEKEEIHKVELLKDIISPAVTIYQQGGFIDLCRGPHLPSTGWVKAFKLIRVAGAYFKGDERNKMLQRIYGVAFPTKERLEKYLKLLEEAKKRDHRKLSKQLNLFSFHEEVGPGLVICHPKGALLRNILEDFEKREHLKRGYQLVKGPQMLKWELWRKSGHLENYLENMYFTKVDSQRYGLKPMNCLSHMLIYKSNIRSYRDLPQRYFELGTVHRHEKSGVLHGLLRLREFTQDDAHIICTPNQLEGEIKNVIDFLSEIMEVFGFDYEVKLGTRPHPYIGEEKDWGKATWTLKKVLENNKLPYSISEGEGAFYGPKIDFILKDSLERNWQCGTIQCDFALPQRFDLTYVERDGRPHRPVMLHRVILGAIERFIGILIEHYGGAFPTWLAPVQIILLTVREDHFPYAQKIYQRLSGYGFRVEIDGRQEKLGFKVREAEIQKIPYMVVIGDKEREKEEISPRRFGSKDLKLMRLEEFVDLVIKDHPRLLREDLFHK